MKNFAKLQIIKDMNMQTDMESWLTDAYERVGVSIATVRAYRSHVTTFFFWVRDREQRDPVPTDFNADALKTFDTARKRLRLAQRSRAAAVAALKNFCFFLYHKGCITAEALNDIRDVTVKVTERPRRRWVTDEQVQALFDACNHVGGRHGDMLAYRQYLAPAVLSVMVYAGLRRSQVCKLENKGLDLSNTPPMLTTLGKGDKTNIIPLHPIAVKHLRAWLEHRPVTDGLLLFDVPSYRRSAPIATLPMTSARLIGILNELCAIADIDPHVITPHAFRRYAATKLSQVEGSSLRDVQVFLGHSDMATTMKYIGLDEKRLEHLVGQMRIMPPERKAPVSRQRVHIMKRAVRDKQGDRTTG